MVPAAQAGNSNRGIFEVLPSFLLDRLGIMKGICKVRASARMWNCSSVLAAMKEIDHKVLPD